MRRTLMFTVAWSCVLSLAAASCSSDAPPDADQDRSSGSTTVPTAKVETFTGSVDDFYEVPDPLPPGEPGELIRTQDLGVQDGLRTLRVMYHSRDAKDRDRAVTGIISHPTTGAPAGGWPVTSQANGTVGLTSQCALSRLGNPAGSWGVEGVHAVTDYIGLGPLGEIHPYLSGPSEGNSVIDAVRAARNLPDANAGKQWFSIGHSQGGHGALFGGERAESYAPELELLGTVSIAPATEVTKTYGAVDEVVTRIVGVMMLYGAQGEYPEIRFEDYAGPELLAAQDVFTDGCLDQIISTVAGIPADTFYKVDPLTTQPAQDIVTKVNQPGLVTTETPLLLIQGTADQRVSPQRTEDFFARVCALGQVTDLLVVEGATHDSIVPEGAPAAATWMNDRLAGEPAPDSCP